MKTVIAHFRVPRVWIQVSIVWLLIFLAGCVTFFCWRGDLFNLILKSPNRDYLLCTLGLIWFSAIYSFFLAFALTKQMIFGKGEALWIENGTLMYVKKWILSCPSNEIVSVSRGKKKADTFVKLDAVIAHLSGGGDKRFPTGVYRETPEDIIARLNAALNLPRK